MAPRLRVPLKDLSLLLTILLFLVATVCCVSPARAIQTRIKDIAKFAADQDVTVLGYGLVMGLQGTGDSKRVKFTKQSLSNFLLYQGIAVDREDVQSKNVAAVIVTAKLPRSISQGARFDVEVGSLGDAKSLEGGVLLTTELTDVGKEIVASAQGALAIGGQLTESAGGGRTQKNYTNVARVPLGGIVVSAQPRDEAPLGSQVLALSTPDFTTAQRIAERINEEVGVGTATALNASTVEVQNPLLADPGERVAFLATVERLSVEPDVVARVVLNERTGTIVAGRNVRLSPVAVCHGNLTINIDAQLVVSQPTPFSRTGETVAEWETTRRTVEEPQSSVKAIEGTTTVGDLAQALNSLGVRPRDLIAIFQAIKEAGALNGELVII